MDVHMLSMQCMEYGYKSWDADNNVKFLLAKRLQTCPGPLVISLACTENNNAPAE